MYKAKHVPLIMLSLILIAYTLFPLPGRALTDADINRMANNILSGVSVGREKRSHAAEITRAMLENGYEPAFVAGFIANFTQEGDFGVFENLNYSSSTSLAYVKHMHGWDYDAGHWDIYGKWSFYTCTVYGNDKYGNPVSLSEVKSLVDTLIKEGHTSALFGLGCIQWTYYSRLRGLVDMYLSYASSDHITEEECISAELAFMLKELKGDYRYVYTGWKSAVTNTDSADAAYSAGTDICRRYENPSAGESAQALRGDLARGIFLEMVNGTSVSVDITPPFASAYSEKNGPCRFSVYCDAFDETGLDSVTVNAWNETDGAEKALTVTLPANGASVFSGCAVFDLREKNGRVNTLWHIEAFAKDTSGNLSPAAQADGIFAEPDYDGLNACSLPEGIITVESEALAGTQVQVVFFPASGGITVKKDAFSGCGELMYIVLPAGAEIDFEEGFSEYLPAGAQVIQK